MVDAPPRVDRSGRRINRLDEFKTPNKDIPEKVIERISCECTTTKAQEVSEKIQGGNSGTVDADGFRCICKIDESPEGEDPTSERVKVESIDFSQTDLGKDVFRDGTESPDLEE